MYAQFFFFLSSIDNSLINNIQKLFSEKIEIFSAVEFSKVSVLTGIIKISLKVNIKDQTVACMLLKLSVGCLS